MNKTVTINLSGIVFHIDENAYELLKKYLEKLKAHFSSTQGKEEIISDIEGRMAEMFSEKNADINRVIMEADVNEIINAMGKPEELPGNEEDEMKGRAKSQTVYSESVRKTFFRNPDDRILGGVCSGIGAYLDIHTTWVRLAFVVLAVLAFGTGVLAYIILWIVVPVAKTPSEKLQMRGEQVNVANIEKNVREELEGLRKRGEGLASELNSEETRLRVRSAAQKTGDVLGGILKGIGKLIAIIFGVFIILISLGALVGLTVAIFSGIGVFTFVVPHTVTNMVLSNSQLWWLIIGGILAVGIPFTLLLLNGLKILFKVKLNLRMIGAVMAGLWLVGIAICILTGVKIASEYQRSATVKRSQMLSNVSGNTLYLKSNDEDINNIDLHDNFIHYGDLFLLDENSDSIWNSLVRFDIEQSDNDSVYMISTFYSRGKTYDEARHLAEEINYSYSVTDSVIMVPKFFNLSTSSKFRGQNVKLVLKVPVGKSVVLDKSLGSLLDNVENVTDTWDWDMLGHEWKMTKDGLECNQCPDISDKDDREHNETHIKIDSNGVEIKTL